MADGHHLRKCFVKKWADFSGYGFNLHAEKGKAGQYIGKVDDGSPAQLAGLREGDRIVEVNDVNIGNENHQQVVTRIKSGGDSVWLLVVDKSGDEFYKNNKKVITSSLDEVKVIECPNSRPTEEPQTATASNEDESNASTAEVHDPEPDNDYETADLPPPAADEDAEEDLPPPPPELTALDEAVNSVSAEPAKAEEPVAEPVSQPDEPVSQPEEPVSQPDEPVEEEKAPTPTEERPAPEPAIEPPKPVEVPKPAEPVKPVEPAAQNGNTDDAVPKMSAAEMREALAKKKKADPRASKVSAKDKLKMFQNL